MRWEGRKGGKKGGMEIDQHSKQHNLMYCTSLVKHTAYCRIR
jgi:hypothetical protein